MKRAKALALAGLLLVMLCTPVLAAEDSEPVVEGRVATAHYTFEAAAGDELHYAAPEELTVGGKSYTLTDIRYEITVRHQPAQMRKTVSYSDAPAEITETVDGRTCRLVAENLPELPRTEYREYTAQADVRGNLTVDSRSYELKNVSTEQRTEPWSAEAMFTTANPASKWYQFNGAVVELGEDPTWPGYEQAVADYLSDSSGSTYQIAAGAWRGDFREAAEGGYTRTAVYTGTRSFTVWIAQYSTAESGEVVYTDSEYPNGWVEAEAIATYNRAGDSVLVTVLKIGGGAAVLALAASGIIFLLKRKKKETTDEESEV